MRDLSQAVPEIIFKGDARRVTIDTDRALDDRGIHGGWLTHATMKRLDDRIVTDDGTLELWNFRAYRPGLVAL